MSTAQPQHIDALPAGQRQLLAIVPGLELQGQHAHAHQVRPVDAFKAFCQHRLDPQQIGALGGPVTAGPCAVFLAGDHHQRRTLGLVLHGGIVDRQLFARWHE
ncbi:hypothetical protein D3C81_1921510 [compost metagenome]